MALEDKLAALIAADEAMRGDSRLALTSATFTAFDDERTFASTEGALCHQRSTECGGGIAAMAVAGGETQVRSFPASFRGDIAQAGYEHFASLGLEDAAPRVAAEAVELLTAPGARAGARRSCSTASSSRFRCTSRSVTRWSSTGCSAPRRRTPARASCAPVTRAACATAPS